MMALADITLREIQPDAKVEAYSLMTSMPIRTYLELADSEDSGQLEIQRNIISARKSRIYDRLVEDLKRGCIMPPIVLVLRSATNGSAPPSVDWNDFGSVQNYVSSFKPKDLAILDGLQRTQALRRAYDQLVSSPTQLECFLQRPVRVEIWAGMSFRAILYRMITLNASQTPMSMKHQLEILNLHMMDAIRGVRSDLDVWQAKQGRRRTQAKQYQFPNLIEAYLAFINKSPFVDPKNQVIDELNRISFLDSFDTSLGKEGLSDFVNAVAEVDEVICSAYPETDDLHDDSSAIRVGYQFFGRIPYLVGFAAAFGRAYHRDTASALAKVQELIAILKSDSDPMAFAIGPR